MRMNAGTQTKVENTACCACPMSSKAWVLFIVPIVALGAAVFFAQKGDNTPDQQPTGAQAAATPAESEEKRLRPWDIDSALEFARQVEKHIADNVTDYTATLLKQERIGGTLMPEETAYVKIRNSPLSVYMNFLAPDKVKGREAIYVDGANNNQLIGHEGSGWAALLGSKWLEPTGPIAMLGQHYPITELGIANLTKRLIEIGEKDKQYGEFYVFVDDNAKVGDRPCKAIVVMHPTKRPQFLFYVARIFVDKERMVPIHYEAYDWPKKPGDAPKLLERYTYANLKLNPGLKDEDFDPRNPKYKFGLKD